MKVIVNEMATEYTDQGNGPVILFLHGWQDSLHSFDSIANPLLETYRVLRLDLPGFGQTELPPKDWYLDDYIEFVVAFIEKINIEPEYIVGHSFGGRIILKALAKKRLSAKKIVLIASAGVSRVNQTRNMVFNLIAKSGKLLVGIPPFSLFRKKMREKLYAFAGSDYLSSSVLSGTFLNVIQEDLSSLVKEISIPALLIWGAEDKATPLADAKFLSSSIKQAQLKVFENCGHHVHQQEPEAVSELIKEFCR